MFIIDILSLCEKKKTPKQNYRDENYATPGR